MADNKSSGRRVSKVKSRMATIREKVESMKVKLQENHRRKHEIGAKLEQRKRALVESLESHIFTLSILDTDRSAFGSFIYRYLLNFSSQDAPSFEVIHACRLM